MKKWTFDYIQRELPKVPKRIPVLVLLNFRDAISEEASVTKDHVSLWVDTNMKRDGEEDGEVLVAESSTIDLFGLLHVHRFINLPFLRAQRKRLVRQLEQNSNELRGAADELKLHLSDDSPFSDYDKFLKDKAEAAKKRKVAQRQGGTSGEARSNQDEEQSKSIDLHPQKSIAPIRDSKAAPPTQPVRGEKKNDTALEFKPDDDGIDSWLSSSKEEDAVNENPQGSDEESDDDDAGGANSLVQMDASDVSEDEDLEPPMPLGKMPSDDQSNSSDSEDAFDSDAIESPDSEPEENFDANPLVAADEDFEDKDVVTDIQVDGSDTGEDDDPGTVISRIGESSDSEDENGGNQEVDPLSLDIDLDASLDSDEEDFFGGQGGRVPEKDSVEKTKKKKKKKKKKLENERLEGEGNIKKKKKKSLEGEEVEKKKKKKKKKKKISNEME